MMLRQKILKIKYLNLATNTTVKIKKNQVKKEIPSINNLATIAALNAKTNEIKNKIYNITNLATTTTALTVVDNKTSNVSTFVKKL